MATKIEEAFVRVNDLLTQDSGGEELPTGMLFHPTGTTNPLESRVGVDPTEVQEGTLRVCRVYLDNFMNVVAHSSDPQQALIDFLTSIATLSFLAGIEYQREKGESP